MVALGDEVLIEVEIARGGREKRHPDGTLDYVSPVPAPFAYGSIVGEWGGDGDPLDVVVVGFTPAAGTRHRLRLVGHVRARDRGMDDDKWVAAPTHFARWHDRWTVHLFFLVYPTARAWVDARKGRSGRFEVLGVRWR
ncbi:MAG: hypothetical protein RLZZ383_2742 [Pseudomonadota bacterium]